MLHRDWLTLRYLPSILVRRGQGCHADRRTPEDEAQFLLRLAELVLRVALLGDVLARAQHAVDPSALVAQELVAPEHAPHMAVAREHRPLEQAEADSRPASASSKRMRERPAKPGGWQAAKKSLPSSSCSG
jgi:hypothetical protein